MELVDAARLFSGDLTAERAQAEGALRIRGDRERALALLERLSLPQPGAG